MINVTMRSARAAALTALVVFAGCSRDQPERSAILPGHHRPMLAHDWPHPREYQFKPVAFSPPSAERALVTARSGVRTFVIADPADPLVRVTAAIPLGRYYERSGEAGASVLLAGLIMRAQPPGATRPLTLQFEELGTQLDSEDAPDLLRLSIEVSSAQWREALALLVSLVRRSSFDASAIAAYRTPSGYSYPTSYVFEAGPVPSAPGEFRPKIELERIMGGYPLSPAEPGIRVSDDALRALAARSLAANLVVFGVGGNVAPDAVAKAVDELTTGWAAAPEPTMASPVGGENRSAGPAATVDVPSLEGWIAIGRPLGIVPVQDRAPLAVAAEVLSTRLNISVREVRGLANRTVCLVPLTGNGSGLLHIRSGGRPEAVAPIVKFSLDEVRRLQNTADKIGDDELATAKGALVLGSWQTALDGARAASTTYAVETVRHRVKEFLSWPRAVEGVTAEQVKTIAARYFDASRMQTMIVGPVEAIRRARHPRWPVALEELK